jgi:hypothetical protein
MSVIDDPAGIRYFHLCQLAGALKIQATTGLRHSKGSVVQQVNREYGTHFRTSRRALEFIESKLEQARRPVGVS